MKGKLYQVHAAFAVSFGQLLMGMLNSWPSYTTLIYTSSTTPLNEPMTAAEVSLLGSLPSLGAVFGSAAAGVVIDRFGRVRGGMILSLPYLLSWTVISVTTSSTLVLMARFLGGVSGGATLVYAPIVISEVAQDDFRGTLASSTMLLYTSGVLVSYILGWLLTYRHIIWVNLLVSVVYSCLTYSIKETPVFLLKQMKNEEARAAIAHYRGVSPSSELVQDQLSKLKQQIMPPLELTNITTRNEIEEAESEKLNPENVRPQEQKKILPIKLLFISPSSRRAFVVVMTFITMQILMGMMPVQVYAKTVFAEADEAHADLYAVVFALVFVCGSLVTTVIADRAGRRVLIISSSVLVSILMSILGYLLQSRSAPPIVTASIIMLYSFCYMYGAGSVPYVLVAELFVSEVQNVASMLVIEWAWFMSFFIIAIFPIFNDLIGIYGTFYCFAAFALCNATIAFYFLPETKGLSIAEIQTKFLKN